ncbi:hypothetical protein KM043_018496 [Ampulex compressa]|nr:hypothetical protein KM043_018496 [Ampulex compressa]
MYDAVTTPAGEFTKVMEKTMYDTCIPRFRLPLFVSTCGHEARVGIEPGEEGTVEIKRTDRIAPATYGEREYRTEKQFSGKTTVVSRECGH